MSLSVHEWIVHFGYMGVFLILFLEMVGIPFPAETTLVVSGVEWIHGQFSFFPLLLAAFLGNVVGSTVAYSLGRTLGRPLLVRYGKYVGINEKRLNKAENQFAKWRIWIVLIGKFIAGVRVLVPYLAGIDAMPIWKFSLVNALSALIWVAFFLLSGRYIGVAWNHYHVFLMHRGLPYLLLLMIILLLGAYFLHFRKRK
ncbi:DedA family protein [Alicyclobacillus tolerans]|uniref:Membrane protein DedA, SNARE-associated domain n=1 Tax=Alicyclobacillus tolerans TaxID=90970 RepID=A0A1M6W606_9BACL|nr:DedA family protein [Alicyclobacillus montanus]SHK89230.1 membrane protein DedA, SNARE-associated domain [Alicyclobacillus montanus]